MSYGGTKVGMIGANRFYETMVFVGKQDGPYVDIDVVLEVIIDRDIRWAIFADQMEDLPDNVDNIANDIHEENVTWFTENFDMAYTSVIKPDETN